MPPHSRLAARYVDRRPTLDHAAQTVRGNLSVPASGVTLRKGGNSLRKLLSYLLPHKGKIALATLLMAVSAVCNLLLPTMMSDILDRGFYGAAEGNTFPYIVKTTLWMLAISTVSFGSVVGGYWIVYHVLADYTCDLRQMIFDKVHTMTLEEVGRLGTSNLVTRITHDVGNLNWVVSMICGNLIIIPLMFLGGVLLCMRKDVMLSLVILLAVPVVIAAVLLMSKRMTGLWEVSDKYCDRQNDLVRERLRGIRVIRAFDRETKSHERISDATRVMSDNIIRANIHMSIVDPLACFVLNLAALLVVFLGGVRIERGSGLTAGDIFAVIQYIGIILSSILSVSFAIIMLPHVKVAARRICEVTDSKATDDEQTSNGRTFSGGIELRNLSFAYPGARENALRDLNLTILPGQKVSVIGGTGSGKSTLVSLLMGFRKPTGGQILFDGVDSAECSPQDIRANISCSLQKAMIFSGTIADNLRMGKPDATDEELWDALELAQQADFVREQKAGLDFKLTQAGTNISGGQKQRLAIARAALRDAPIYIFDDSFSALDFLTEAKVRGSINRRTQGRTQIVVTQRVVSAMHSDLIVVLSDGAVVGLGRHEDLLRDCGIYREIFHSQTGGGAE